MSSVKYISRNSRLSKRPEESIEEYISRRDNALCENKKNDFTSIEELTKQINEVEEGFFKIQEILMKCSRTSRRKIKQRFFDDDF